MATLPDYYSQYGEDQWIVENLRLPAKGFFVEVGAGDGVDGSNSLHFEKKGWDGIVVEPDPRSLSKLVENRKCRIDGRCVGTPGEVRFNLQSEPTLSGIARTGGRGIILQAVALADILRDVPSIDLLSIDAEGTELEVWAGIGPHRPQVVIIEYNTLGIRNDPGPIRRELGQWYMELHRTEANLIMGLR